jgi:hypothetical protein
MGLINRVKVWVFGDVLTDTALNNEFNNILNVINGNLDSANIGTLNVLNLTRTTAGTALTLVHTSTGQAFEINCTSSAKGIKITTDSGDAFEIA